MNLKIFYALILTILPISELRLGLPVALSYAREENIPIALIFSLVILLNILFGIFLYFTFLINTFFLLILKYIESFLSFI